MHSTDWLPTLSAVAGYTLEGTRALDGVNQWPVLSEGEKTTRTTVVVNSPAAAAARGGGIRVGPRHKLLFEGASELLFFEPRR